MAINYDKTRILEELNRLFLVKDQKKPRWNQTRVQNKILLIEITYLLLAGVNIIQED